MKGFLCFFEDWELQVLVWFQQRVHPLPTVLCRSVSAHFLTPPLPGLS